MQLYEYIGWKFAIFNVYRLSGIKAGRISPVLIPLNLVWDGDLVKQVRTPPVRPADGVVGCVYESFVPGEDCRGLGLRAKIKSAEHAPAL